MSHTKRVAICACAVTAVTIAYFLTFWNRFLGPSVSGMFLEFAERWREGAVPYRDFFMVVTPFYMFKTRAVSALFGSSLEVQRIVEIATRCLLGIIVFVWLTRTVRLSYAVLATIAGAIMFCADLADPLTSYHHESVFWAVLGAFLFSFSGGERWMKDFWLLFGAGFCCAISLLTKQTTGAGSTLALACLIALLAYRTAGSASVVRSLAVYVAGWSVPIFAVGTWLVGNGALWSFIDDVIITGPASKGSTLQVLMRPIVQPLQSAFGTSSIAVSLFAAYILVRLVAREAKPNASADLKQALCLAALCGGAIVLAVGITFGVGPQINTTVINKLDDLAIRIAFFCIAALAIHYLVTSLRHKPDEYHRQRLILTVISFTTAYMLSLSWAAFGPMALPSLAVVLAFALEAISSVKSRLPAVYAVVTMTAGLIAIAECQRLLEPFRWVDWADPPVKTATTSSALPQLSRLSLGDQVKTFTDSLTQLVIQNSQPNDAVFIFPYQPLFYVLSGRQPATLALVHWFDVTPDSVCREDAERLVQRKPTVIVDFVLSPFDFESNEQIFRHGQRSGQRDLYEQMYRLIRKHYHLQASLREPGWGREVRVFVRNAS